MPLALWLFIVVCLCALSGCRSHQSLAFKALHPQETALCTFTGGALYEKDLAAKAPAALFNLQQECYAAKSRLVEDLAFDQLLQQAAMQQGLTPASLLQKEVDAHVPPPSDALYQQVKRELRQLKQLPTDEVMARKEVVDFIQHRERAKRFKDYRAQLLQKGQYLITLPPPRMAVPLRPHSPHRGPLDAPITLVEFSDYACPFSRAAQDTLKQVWALYPDQIHHIWRAMPIAETLATETALWANKQGKYWQLRHLLFSTPGDLTPVVIKRLQNELALPGELENDADAKRAVQQDLEDAKALGLESSPCFFINGRLLKGAAPLNGMAPLLNEELRRAGHPLSPEQMAAAVAP